MFPQVPQFPASVDRLWHPSKQLLSPVLHSLRQCPVWHICPGKQETPQSPQFSRSFMISVQLTPQILRSDGQVIAFVGIGLVTAGEGMLEAGTGFSP